MAAGNVSLAADRFITVASTTSTANSGLFDHILPAFTQTTGIEVRVVAVGTGQAIRHARNGDADVLFVHHRPSEEAFVAEGYGVERRDVMYNDFVVVGPASDPAGIKGDADVAAALGRIAAAKATFASRGDDSGTHKRGARPVEGCRRRCPGGERRLGIARPAPAWGATLNTASGMEAYALTDRATWLNFGNKGTLEILVEGDKRLFNQYGVDPGEPGEISPCESTGTARPSSTGLPPIPVRRRSPNIGSKANPLSSPTPDTGGS